MTIVLPEQEKSALYRLAEQGFREPHDQVALIIHKELVQGGLLSPVHGSSECHMDAEKLVADRKKLLDLMSTFPVLVTTNNWFRASDGKQYTCVWGHASIISATALLGFEPAQSTNWLMVFDGGKHTLVVGGCQINYIQICPDAPDDSFILRVIPEG